MNRSWRCSLVPALFSVVLMLSAFLAAACGPTTAPTPAPPASNPASIPGGTLRVGLPFISQPPDPVRGGFQPVQTGVAETLFKLGADLKPEPWLATNARQLDEQTWEITLRQGVKFHNGDLMDATAVKASLDRAGAKSPRAKNLLDISQLEVTDASTVIITTNKPSPILPALLTELSAGIVNAAAAEALGDAFTEKPVLTGPFMVERFQLDKELAVVRHPDYWGTPALLDRVIFLYLPDNNSRVLALQSGDIDIAVNIAPESAATVAADRNLAVRSAPPIYLEFLYLNHQRGPWKDARVRQAVASAIDREGLVKAISQNQAITATGPFPPAMFACPQLRGISFDPSRARVLLAEAGYRDNDGDGIVEKEGQPLAMKLLTYRQRPELPPMAEAIQAALKTVGIKVEVALVEQIDAALRQGDWDGAMYFTTMGISGDPYLNLSQYFNTGGSANFGGYSNPLVDGVTAQLRVAKLRQTREDLACSASQSIVDDVAVVPLLYPNFLFGVSKRVTGFDNPHPFSWYFVDNKMGKK